MKRPRITYRIQRSLFPQRSPDTHVAFATVGKYRIEASGQGRRPSTEEQSWCVLEGDQLTPQAVLLTFDEALLWCAVD
jgi:hypothetical protein